MVRTSSSAFRRYSTSTRSLAGACTAAVGSGPAPVTAAAGALAALEKAGQQPGDFLSRHVTGDWGEVPPEDIKENKFSLRHGFRLLSAYRTSAVDKIRVITEADRSSTCVLLPEEY